VPLRHGRDPRLCVGSLGRVSAAQGRRRHGPPPQDPPAIHLPDPPARLTPETAEALLLILLKAHANATPTAD
jgi:hypothetical protein